MDPTANNNYAIKAIQNGLAEEVSRGVPATALPMHLWYKIASFLSLEEGKGLIEVNKTLNNFSVITKFNLNEKYIGR